MSGRPPKSPPFPYPTLSRSGHRRGNRERGQREDRDDRGARLVGEPAELDVHRAGRAARSDGSRGTGCGRRPGRGGGRGRVGGRVGGRAGGRGGGGGGGGGGRGRGGGGTRCRP